MTLQTTQTRRPRALPKAAALKRGRLALCRATGMAAGLVLAAGLVHAQRLGKAQAGRAASLDLRAAASLIVETTNAFRAAQDRKPLERNAELDKAAQEFAEYMARTGRYSHTADGKQPSERIAQHGYAYCGAAENIAYAFRSQGFTLQTLSGDFVQGWIDSPPHRKNMLDANLVEIGVGIARSDATGYYYAVQDFGRPKSARIEFTVANESTESVQYSLDGESYTLAPRYTRTHRQCREPVLEFSLRGRRARSVPTKFTPEAGDRFSVAGTKGALRVVRRGA